MKNIWSIPKKKLEVYPAKTRKKKTLDRKKKTILFLETRIPFSLTEFRHDLNMKIVRSMEDEIVVQMEGIDFSIVNSFRRILLGETTTFAIDKVFFYENSSILNDEIIAHRLSLIPLSFPPNLIDFFSTLKQEQKLIFELKVTQSLSQKKGFPVLSNSLKWRSYGLFDSLLKNFEIKPVFRDILVLKLNPGQKVNCECHCSVGTGTIHAKFSPVGTTFYRIFPRIKITSEILGKTAETFFKKCPVRVFDIENSTTSFLKKLFVSSPEFCTFCKECLTEKMKNSFPIKIGRVKNKVTFVIETTGVLAPDILLHRAIFLLVGKCNEALSTLYNNFSLKKTESHW